MTPPSFSPVWERAVLVAGLLHFAQVPSMVIYRRQRRAELAALTPVSRHFFDTLAIGMAIVILGLGGIVAANARFLSSGSAPAPALLGFLALFWGYRVSAQVALRSASAPAVVPRGWYWVVLAVLSTKAVLYAAAFLATSGIF